MQQMARALLTPEITPTQASSGDTYQRPLDPSQEEAAHAARGPLLLEAGPGTGKTRTLIGRIVFLLEQNVPPSTILVLTFSNRAAEEMRSRVADANPQAASRIWIGTFHAFGLELLRKYNYRSQPAIVDVFAGLAPNMRASRGGPSFSRWEPKRSDSGGRVLMEVADDLTAEAEGIAKEIERQRDSGISYSQQAILCRSHTNLGRVGTELEALGVPVLYLGNLFERPEVPDMLSLLSLTCEPDGRGLVRVARFPEYEVPLDLTPTRRRDCA